MIARRTEGHAWHPNHLLCSMIGQGATQASSPSPAGQPPSSRVGNDAAISALACAPFDSILSPALPATSSPADQRRPSAKAPHPSDVLKCPRCDSLDTKFCYYNNYSLTQPRYFCKNCKRYWTAGGALRNVPVGGGLRKNKRSKLKLAAATAADAEAALAAQVLTGGGGNAQPHAKAAGEGPPKVDNRTAPTPANAAAPSHLVVGLPEMGMYTHSTKPHVGEGLSNPAAPHYIAEHMVDQKDAACAAAPTLHPQAGNYYGKDETSAGPAYFCDPAQVPQFYSSYAASLPIQFAPGNTGVPPGAVPGYALNYNFFQADPNGNSSNEDVGSASLQGVSIAGPSRGDVKHEKDTEGSENAYDWQIMSEGLFNGTGASDNSFLYAPSSSWPDFSQFNDTGPG